MAHKHAIACPFNLNAQLLSTAKNGWQAASVIAHTKLTVSVQYCKVGNFHRVQFSRMVDLYHFVGLIFADACTHSHYVLYNRAYFAVRQSSAKTAKISRYTVVTAHVPIQCKLNYNTINLFTYVLCRQDQKIYMHASDTITCRTQTMNSSHPQIVAACMCGLY